MSDNVNETEGLNEVPGQVFVEEAIPLPPDMEEPAMTEVAPEVPQDDTAKEDIAEAVGVTFERNFRLDDGDTV